MKYNHQFLYEMPKTDLHLHLDGSVRLDSLIEMSKEKKIHLPSYTKEGLRESVFKDSYANLGEYLQGFRYTCEVLRDLENIERTSYELAQDNIKENVFYIEVRFAPQLLINHKYKISMEDVLVACNKGLERAKNEYNISRGERPHFNYGIICCAMRMFGPQDYSPYYTNLFKVMSHLKSQDVIRLAAEELVRAAVKLRDEQGIPIVGIDLAGQEEGYPSDNFKSVYEYAHKHFLRKTVHAGEAYGAESIFQAVTECYADRIGHGYSLFMPNLIKDESINDKEKYISDLASFLADKRTVIEVCLTSNMQTNPKIKTLNDHKFKNMLDNRMATTICTDNRLVSNTTVTKEYIKAVDNFDIPIKRLKDIVAYGFKKSFYPDSYVRKRIVAKEMMIYFDNVYKKYSIE